MHKHTSKPRKQKSLAKCHALATGMETERAHRGSSLQTPVLVLNASYEPINICGARRALVLVLKGIARTEEEILVRMRDEAALADAEALDWLHFDEHAVSALAIRVGRDLIVPGDA